MNQNACRSELVLAERRGSLNVNERDTLCEHLRDCEHCRILRDYGRAFDEPESIRPDDVERLDGMLDAAHRWLGTPRRLRLSSNRSRHYKTLWLAAAMTICASAAAAAIAIQSPSMFRRTPGNGHTQPAISKEISTTSSPLPIQKNKPFDTTSHAPELELDALASSSIITTAKAKTELVAPQWDKKPERTATNSAQAVGETAGQLFHQANEARRSKNAPEAIRLFRKLQRLYPTSREARLSEVVLGMFLLEQGQANAALEQLNRYLASGSGQSLTAEAYYGKSKALAQLGRLSEEQATWRVLLEQFPKSPYASQARKRLFVAP
jgi:TolA-binding protein